MLCKVLTRNAYKHFKANTFTQKGFYFISQRWMSKQKLLILGGGWAGFRILKDIDLNHYDVDLVAPRNHFLFTPLLASTSVGTLEFRSIAEPIRGARDGFQYYQAKCTHIDVANKEVECKTQYEDEKPFKLKYDKLVIAVGCDVNTMGVKGVKEYANFMKELGDARAIRQKIISCFERANNPSTPLQEKERLLRFVIVGAGPTGVEAAAEIHDFIDQDLKTLFPDIYLDAKITILEASNQILSAFDKDLQKFTMKKLKAEKIQIRLGAIVKEVTENEVILNDGSVIPYGFVLWSAGIQPRKLIANHENSPGLPRDPRNRIIVDGSLQVKGLPDVYALGDCSIVIEKPFLATAQVANQQAKYLAKKLNFEAKEKKPFDKEFIYSHKGLMAYIGSYKAVSDLKNVKLRGFIAWFVWRSAYLTSLVSIRNKILVPMDWLKTFIFGRDLTNF